MEDASMKNRFKINVSLAEMLKGGVIMDVINAEQAKIAENTGAVAVMALERVPADIKSHRGVARMSDPRLIKEIMKSVSIPVMAKVRVGHFVEAQILQELGVDFIDESEVLTHADDKNHINKREFNVPFVCGCTNLGEALRRISEGSVLIRTKGEAGTGDIAQAVKQMRLINKQIKEIRMADNAELMGIAKHQNAPFELVQYVHKKGKLPVPNFSAGGIATPADAAMMMQLGSEALFVGSGIFKSDKPEKRAQAIVSAVANYEDPSLLAKVSENLGVPMGGINYG